MHKIAFLGHPMCASGTNIIQNMTSLVVYLTVLTQRNFVSGFVARLAVGVLNFLTTESEDTKSKDSAALFKMTGT